VLSNELRRKLSRLAAQRGRHPQDDPERADRSADAVQPEEVRAPEPDASSDPCPVFFPVSTEATDLASLLGGGEQESGDGVFWFTEVELERAWAPGRDLWDQLRACDQPPADMVEVDGLAPSDLVFFDIETAGLSGATLFLAGTLDLRDGAPMLRFFLARDYAEEQPMLQAFRAYFAGFRAVVSFNGKSFDVPFLRDRARYHRMSVEPPPIHVDVLHAARRRWKGKFGDCRLVTLERELLDRHRHGDTPSHLIPDVYHEYVATGDPGPLVPILQHNGLDLVSLAELLCLGLATPPAPRR